MTAAILDGVVLGLQFGILAVGFTLVYGLGGILNLSYGQIAIVAAVVVSLMLDASMPLAVAIAGGLLTGAIFGLLLDSTLLRAVYRRRGEARVLLSLLLTLGVASVVDGLLLWRVPSRALSLHITGDPIVLLGIDMRRGAVMASAIALATFAVLYALLSWTTRGRAIRSIIQDEEGSRLIGVDPGRMRTLILVLSGLLACLVAVTRSMTSPVTVTQGVGFTIFALIVTVVGGLGSVAGAFLAGIILGIVNTVSSFYIGSFLTYIILLGAAALTILLRPSGLLGARH
jgi:branched-chain amino acid transport system permease protein